MASHVVLALEGAILLLLAGAFAAGAGYAIVANDFGKAWALVPIVSVRAPAVLLFGAFAAALIGVLPRAAGVASWSLFGMAGFLILFGDLLDLPVVLQALSPFDHVPRAPGEPLDAAGALALVAVALAFVVAGFLGFRNRDTPVAT